VEELLGVAPPLSLLQRQNGHVKEEKAMGVPRCLSGVSSKSGTDLMLPSCFKVQNVKLAVTADEASHHHLDIFQHVEPEF
jgi:hypothetical protein